MIPFSILDLSPIPQGASAADALRNSLDLAQHAEAWGYNRYWLAEHHNMPGIASAATSIVIGHVAAGTKTIRVGSGGIMLPNHSPLVIAEQFGTLASLFPGRIELGLGRAPGTDQATVRALRRDPIAAADRFPDDVLELQHFFEEPEPGQKVRAVPGMGLEGADLAAGVEFVQRAVGGADGIAVRVCVAFCAGGDDGRGAFVSGDVSAVERVGEAVPDAGDQCDLRGDGWRGAEAVHVGAAVVYEFAARDAGADSTADR